LSNVSDTSTHVASDEIAVHRFEVRGTKNAACQNAFTKSGSKSLNLALDFRQHIYRRSIRDVTVSPSSVLPVWRTRWIKQARLREQNERALGDLPVSRCTFRNNNFIEASAKVNGSGALTITGLPGNWLAKRVINFECSRAVPETTQDSLITLPQSFARYFQKLLGSEVAKIQIRFWQLIQ